LQIDAKQSSSKTHRILIYALLASLVAHVFGRLYLPPEATLVNSLSATPNPGVFNVTLKTSQTPQRVDVSTTEVQQTAQEIVTTISRYDSPQQPTENQKRHTQNNPKPSKLKIPSTAIEIKRFLKGVPETPSSKTTVNGAVVMNQTIHKALQQNPGIEKFTEAASDSPRLATYDAGSWTEWVQFGNTCFHVKRANPLEPYSNEAWYRTACH
jgi:hypothetical protein